MTHITVKEESSFAPRVNVEIIDTNYNRVSVGIARHNLRQFVETAQQVNGQVILWQDNRLMRLCATSGCNALVRASDEYYFCPRCLDPMAPNYAALGAESEHTAMEDSRLAAEMIAIR